MSHLKAGAKAFGAGLLAIGGAISSLGVAGSWLWMVGAGDVAGVLAILMVPIALLALLVGLGLVAMIGDAVEKWDGGT